jgi:hypothetical protein
MKDPFVIKVVWRGVITHRVEITDVSKHSLRAKVQPSDHEVVISRGAELTLNLPTILVNEVGRTIKYNEKVQLEVDELVELIGEVDP